LELLVTGAIAFALAIFRAHLPGKL
jgi:hypothetical protein